jgi:CspA family cold shock protein
VTVKFFNAQKGFGFIVQDGRGPDVFVHISAVERTSMSNLNEGQKLSFDVQANARSGKSAAANLQAGGAARRPGKGRARARLHYRARSRDRREVRSCSADDQEHRPRWRQKS